MAPRQRIAWKSKITGHSGNGPWLEPDVNLRRIIDALNREQPDIHHWIEYESWTEIDTSIEDTEIV